jgi:lambda repressor-like predicted transcriptional regulator
MPRKRTTAASPKKAAATPKKAAATPKRAAAQKGKHDVTQAQVDRLQKAGHTLESAAEELGVAPSSIVTAYYLAEINEDPSLEIKGGERTVAKGVVSQRKQGVRWKRLSVRSGLSEARVKQIWEEETGIPSNETWTGRGAPPPGMDVEEAREIAEVRPATADDGDEPAPKRGGAKRGAAKRSSAKSGAAKRSTAKRTGKARTRAERLAKSGKNDPS